MKKLDKNSLVPLYQQMVIAIQEDIKSQVYLYGEQIPTEIELGEKYGVSRIVVRQAISVLVEKGYVIKKRGKGTFVSYPKVVEVFNANGSFTKSCILQGIVPKTQIISNQIIKREILPSSISNYFEEEELLLIERLRYADDKPVILELDYFRKDLSFLLGEDLEKHPIMEVIREHKGLIATYFEDVVDIVSKNKRLHDIFKSSGKSHMLRVTQKVLTKDNELIYVNVQYIESEIYQYAVRYGGDYQ